MKFSVVILTFNSEDSIRATLDAAKQVSDDIWCVDSYSTDTTMEILEGYGVNVVQRPFKHYADQRNWAIASLDLKHGWQLHLDADERLTPDLIAELQGLPDEAPSDIDGYMICRITSFMGRELRHGGMYPQYHMRLFRSGAASVENKKYDQHFLLQGRSAMLKNAFIDEMNMSLTEWTTRHNKWSNFEIDDQSAQDKSGRVEGRADGNPIERKRYLRNMYGRLPLFVRPMGLFIYRYIFRLGFLDGKEGFIFYVLQTFWYRFLIDAKIFERRHTD